MTGRQLVAAALRQIGVLAAGETPEADEATDGLAAINRMLAGWSTQRLAVYARIREEFTLTANDGIYSMGSSGDFNTSRPIEIEAASIELQTPSPKLEVPVRLQTFQEYAAIPDKDRTSSIPTDLWVDMTNPLLGLYLYPVPTVAEKLVLYSLKELTQISTLDTSLTFPPGYERALVFNGAVEISPEYGKSHEPSEVVIRTALESLGDIKRMNSKPHLLRCDGALLSGRTVFNIYTGGSR